METGLQQSFSLSKKERKELQHIWYAGFWIRFWAYLIDLIVIWGVNSIVTRPLIRFINLEEAKLWINMFSASNILTTLIFFLYFILLTKYFKATLGKMILGLKVHPLNRETMTTSQVVFRECVGRYISMAILGLPYLVVAFTKRHQGVHDYFADTSVIKEKFIKLNKAIEKEESLI